MAAHLNITSTIATVYGVTLHADAEADDCGLSQSVEISELAQSTDNEIIAAAPTNTVTKEATVSGDGPIALALTPGTIATPSDFATIELELGESPNNRCTFTARASASAAFTDPAGTVSAVGAEPAIGDLEVTSVEYSIVESVRRTSSITDMVLTGSDGTPAARATTRKMRSFSIAGRGDTPAGVALGTGGTEFVGGDTGVVVVSTLTSGEKRGDWNRWGADGNHYLAAS